jgi:hypothetical protein
MKIFFLITSFLFLLPACKNRDAIPRGILSQEKMQGVIRDMMRADQFLADFVLNRDTLLNKRIESTILYQQVLALHKISNEDFKKSFSWYQAHPTLMKVIMDSISKIPVASLPVIQDQPTPSGPVTIPVKDTVQRPTIQKPMRGN